MTTEPRAQTLRFQSAVNRITSVLLRVPVLSGLVGSRLIVIDVVGRKSGKTYQVPVAYTRSGPDLLVGTPFAWGRNLRTGEPVTVLYKGRRRRADVLAITDEPGVVAAFAEMARDNRQFAGFNKIALDPPGNPDENDLHLAFAGGARAFRLTLVQ
jgi:hypothetical protein